MTSVLETYLSKSRRHRRRAKRLGQRLDIQGLRMVAVLTVLANHLWDWPRGGFIGVDVFFVISGFLITGNLLRTAETRGNVSFRRFYWNRVRRIVPAATVVLVLTYLASLLVFQPFRAEQVGVDALWAFVFASNWWFGVQGTDYFTAGAAVSPIQHYWSLSIEEQFYFVWPALIFLIGVFVARKAWTHAHRMRAAGTVMAIIVAASLAWAMYETAASPAWAYFNTFARVWELGVGALLATAVSVLARIPVNLRPWLSWGGLGLIAASVFLIGENSVGFPAPWALLPVAGSALVIAAGVGVEPARMAFLRNPVSVYIGNISYSLYLVHWPVIVILAAVMPQGAMFYLAAVAMSFGLAIASFQFVENPLRYADWGKTRLAATAVLKRRYTPRRSSGYAVVGALTLVAVALGAYTVGRPLTHHQLPPTILADTQEAPATPRVGPLTSALQQQITQALAATEWPQLDPSMEAAMSTAESPPEVHACNFVDPLQGGDTCSWGSPTAPVRIVVVGDSIALSYTGPLRDLALNSGGQIQVRAAAMGGCAFVDTAIFNADQSVVDACPDRKQHAVDLINSTKPQVVVISHLYEKKRPVGSEDWLTDGAWSTSLRQQISKFRDSVEDVVLLSAPPSDKNVTECYGARSSVPADCISQVENTWLWMARAEREVAESVGGVWIDSRPWFCTDGYCPSFVGSTPTKLDRHHMSTAYGLKIHPVIGEAFRESGVF